MFEAEGFEVVDDHPVPGTAADLELIAQLPPAAYFADRHPQDLATRLAFVTLTPAS